MYLFLDDSKKSKQVRLVDTVTRIFGESTKDKVSIIAANFFGIPEALASWVRQERIFLKRQQSVLCRIWNNDVWVHSKRYYDVGVNIVLGCRQTVRHRTLTPALSGSIPLIPV